MTLRCALVGTGGWARMALVPALRAVPALSLEACLGIDLPTAQAFAAEQGIRRTYDAIEALMAAERPDLLIVATPDHLHPLFTRAGLEGGAAVYCEKPLANDAATAGALADLARRSAPPATIGFSFRYRPAIQALKADLAAGRLGEPWLIELYEHNPQFHPLRGKPLNWKGDPAQAAAGALFEYGSHIVDLAGWLVGPVRRVSTSFTRVVPGARLDDIATLQMQFDAPAIGTLVASWVLAGSFPGIRIRLHGSEGLGEAIVDQSVAGGEVYQRIPPSGGPPEPVPTEPVGQPVYGQVQRHLADLAAVITGRPPLHAATLPTLDDAARAQSVLEAALAATERWQAVPP